MLYVSGQGPLDLVTGKVVEGNIEDQTRLALSHVGKILDADGCSLEDVVNCTCHLDDIDDFDCFNRVYEEFFRGMRPARTTVQSVLWGGRDRCCCAREGVNPRLASLDRAGAYTTPAVRRKHIVDL